MKAQPENDQPSTPSPDKRKGADRQWRATVERLRSGPVSEVAAENVELRRSLLGVRETLNGAIVAAGSEALAHDLRGRLALLDMTIDRYPVRDEPATELWRWTVEHSDVDGQDWSEVQRGTATSEADALAAAAHVRDENTLPDVIESKTVDL